MIKISPSKYQRRQLCICKCATLHENLMDAKQENCNNIPEDHCFQFDLQRYN